MIDIDNTRSDITITGDFEEIYNLIKDKEINSIKYDDLESLIEKDIYLRIKEIKLSYNNDMNLETLLKFPLMNLKYIEKVIAHYYSPNVNYNINLESFKKIYNYREKLNTIYEIFNIQEGRSLRSFIKILNLYFDKEKVKLKDAINKKIEKEYNTSDFINFLYINNLEKWISSDNKTENNKTIELFDQKYKGTHTLDDKVVALLNNMKSRITEFRDLSRNSFYLDFEYILNNIVRYNKNNLYKVSALLNIHYKGASFRRIKNISDEDYKKIFNSLRIKYSKYVLKDSEEAYFIKDYYEQEAKKKS